MFVGFCRQQTVQFISQSGHTTTHTNGKSHEPIRCQELYEWTTPLIAIATPSKNSSETYTKKKQIIMGNTQ